MDRLVGRDGSGVPAGVQDGLPETGDERFGQQSALVRVDGGGTAEGPPFSSLVRGTMAQPAGQLRHGISGAGMAEHTQARNARRCIRC